MSVLHLLDVRERAEPEAPHYRCPTCLTRSDDLGSQAEADLLLETHRTYFCRPAATPTPSPFGHGT
ncbi:MAG TPA: hypothetical protein VMT43_07450 [Acidimicrobiales bacterium]|nr:hypothetical protein [Acidimicrobiales bacterium]